MKITLRVFSLLVCGITWAQTTIGLDEIAEAEAKSAYQNMHFSPNTNTGNYDLKYHRLELTLDPNVAFISGDVTSHFVAKEDCTESPQ